MYLQYAKSVYFREHGKYRKDFLVVQLEGRAYTCGGALNDPVMEEMFSTLLIDKI